MYKFTAASADESIVFGAARPGYADKQVSEWIEFMLDRDIAMVICWVIIDKLSEKNMFVGHQLKILAWLRLNF
jgi:hypothetical protein